MYTFSQCFARELSVLAMLRAAERPYLVLTLGSCVRRLVPPPRQTNGSVHDASYDAVLGPKSYVSYKGARVVSRQSRTYRYVPILP